MDKQGREYKYQVNYTANGKMYNVRCDDWKEFTEAIAEMEKAFSISFASTPTPPTPTPTTYYPTPASMPSTAPEACKTCGNATLPEKRITGKDGRSWWVRDCSTGDKTHKGPIRPAV